VTTAVPEPIVADGPGGTTAAAPVGPSIDGLVASLPPELRRLRGRPFGRDEAGEVIAHGSGRIVAGAVRYLQAVVGDRMERAIEPGVDLTERTELVARARSEVLEQLVALINGAVPDDRYHVTGEYLLTESNNYSYEFRLFVAEYCRLLAGDPDFFFNQGRRSIPGSIVLLARPIGIRQTYAVLPRFTAKFVKTDLRVVSTGPASAVIRWHAASQLEHVPGDLHRRYLAYACAAYRGTFAAIPTLVAGLAPATVRQVACQLDGAEMCEWEFSWQRPASVRSPRALAAGVGGSLAMLGYLALRLPGWEAVSVVAATLLPAGLVLYGGDARRRARDLRTQQQLLLEQRDLTEREYDRSEQANAELQQINLELEHRISELMTLNEIGVAASATLDVDELVDRCLRAVVGHLRFDRALVLLADEERGVLTHGRSVGANDEMEALVGGLALPLDHPNSQLASLYRADGPLLFRDVDRDEHEANRQLALALGVTSFLGTPLVTKGRTMGVLAVDNRLSGREVEPGDGPLLFTVGNLIASALENARLYAEIEQHNRALEGRVEERTAQLRAATEEADEARTAAEAASAAKSQFLANVSHELRTPLTSVVGFTKLVRRRLDDVVFPAIAAPDARVERAMRQARDNLEIMASEGDRLTTMINDVLDLAKIEAGKLEWRSDAVAMVEVVERATAATSSLVGHAGLELVVDVPPVLPPVLGDRDRLIQVLINLLSNAVKFTPSGTITVGVRAGTGELTVSVADTGVGIRPEDHEKVFEQFLQAGDTLTDKPRGTGLGLPICRQIVEHHGGRIWLDSAPGSGSTFSFSLPLAVGAVSPPPGAPSVPDPIDASRNAPLPVVERRSRLVPFEGPERRRDGPATVVLVEDDPATRELVRQVLEASGVRLLEASNGEDGLELVRSARPAIAILDVVLPGIDGFEVVERIRADPAIAGTRIAMLSVVEDRERATRLGVERYLTKPFDADRLAIELESLVQFRAAAPSPGA
jgi:signal transduction histidine kinase/ActR/RegA family two-component response regulator